MLYGVGGGAGRREQSKMNPMSLVRVMGAGVEGEWDHSQKWV